jgi:cytoskeletal protein CcmA (bactofilin family)
MAFATSDESHTDRVVTSAQEEIRRVSRDDGGPRPEAASSISSGLSIIGKVIGRGALTIFGHVEGELRASSIVIAEGAQMEGDVVAEELTINGHVKGAIRANRVRLGGTAVIEGDILHQTWRSRRMLVSRECRDEARMRSTRRRSFTRTKPKPTARATEHPTTSIREPIRG